MVKPIILIDDNSEKLTIEEQYKNKLANLIGEPATCVTRDMIEHLRTEFIHSLKCTIGPVLYDYIMDTKNPKTPYIIAIQSKILELLHEFDYLLYQIDMYDKMLKQHIEQQEKSVYKCTKRVFKDLLTPEEFYDRMSFKIR